MGSKRMLLNILPSDITKIHRELFKYIATRVIFAANWKRVKCPDLKEWKNKYVTLAKVNISDTWNFKITPCRPELCCPQL